MVIPNGQFVGNSTYGDAYIPGTVQRSEQFRPEGQLKVGGKFEGNSSYASDYEEKNQLRRQKIQFKENEIMPKGNFNGNSTYQANYLNN